MLTRSVTSTTWSNSMQARQDYHLVQLDASSARHSAEVERGLISALDVYDAFHFITRQPGWGAKDERVMISDDEEDSAWRRRMRSWRRRRRRRRIGSHHHRLKRRVHAGGVASGRYVSIRLWWLQSSAPSIKSLATSSLLRRRYGRRLTQSGVPPVCDGNDC